MKKIVILCLLFLISNNAYSQITTNWEKSSAKNNYPKGFMGTSHTERGFATGKITLNPFTTIMERSGVNKNYPSYLGTANTDRGFAYGFSNNQEKLYVVARKVGTNVFILNAATGDSIGKLNNTGITGGTLPLNDVEVSQDGVIFACNLTVNASTSSFKVYKWNNDNAEPKVVVEYTGLALRFGDKFTVTGNTSDNTVTIWAVAAGNKKVVKFTTTNKGETFTASEINLTGLAVGNSPAIYPDLTANEIYINSNGQPLKRYAMNGTLKDSVPTTIIGTGSNSLRVFYYNNRKFIATYVYGSGNENIRVVEVTDGLINAKLVGVTPSMYSVSNANGVGDIDFKKNSDGTYNLYVLGTNNGIAAYKILPTQYGTFERMYIVSRLSGNKIIALNAETGDSLKVLDVTGIAGGTFLINDAEVAASGEIFACNLTTNASTSPFKFYKWYDESSKPIEVINYNKLALRFGDKFTVTGSSKDNTLTIWAVAASSNKIVKFTTNDNGLTFTPQEITLSDANVLNSPVVYPNYDGTKLYVNSNGTALKEYDNTGKFLDAVPTSIIGTGTNALRYFETEKKKFLAVYTYGSGNENLRIIEITNGLSNAALVATTPSLGNLSNSNGVGDCSFSLNTDGTVNLYILATNNGIASYKFTAPKDVAPPMFTPAPGTYLNSVIVKLSTTVGAKIYYTLDETEPTTNSFLYADSIKITETRTIKAIGVLGSVVSKVASGTYYINKVVPPAQMYTLWQKSQANNNLPKYISKENYERGMTVGTFNGKQRVVLVARWLGPKVILIDPFKGDSLATILPDVNVTGGTFPINFPTLSDDGVLFVGNMTIDASSSPFKVYRYDKETDASTTVIELKDPSLKDARIGDMISSYGKVKDNTFTLYAAISGQNKVIRFTTNDYGKSFKSEIINLKGGNIGTVPVIAPVYQTTFYLKSYGKPAYYYHLNGTLLDSIPTSVVGTDVTNIKYFESSSKKYLLCYIPNDGGILSDEKIALVDISTNSVAAITKYISSSIGNNINLNATGAVGYLKLNDDNFIYYIFGTNNGLGAFTDNQSVVINQTETLFYGNTATLLKNPYGTGYVAGTNGYGDLGKYQRFDFKKGDIIHGLRYYFAFRQIVGKPDTVSIVIKKSKNNQPDETIYSDHITSDRITTDMMGNLFMLNNPIVVDGPIFAGFEFTNTANDTIAIYTDKNGEGNKANRAWEKFNDGSYNDFGNVLNPSYSWNLDLDLWIAAYYKKGITTDVEEVEIPVKYSLEQNYPNPFNPSTTIKFSLKNDAIVSLKVYNLIGQEVATLVNEERKAGNHIITFKANNLASGVYFYRFEAKGVDGSNFSAVKKLLLMK